MQNLITLFGVISLLICGLFFFLGWNEERKNKEGQSNKCSYYLVGIMFFMLFAFSMIKDTDLSSIVVYPLF